jgi:thioredoxin 1
MAAVHFTDQDFEEKVLKSKIPVLVDFHAEWCGPCKLAEPIIEELSETYKGKVLIGKLDVDENQQVSQTYGVMSIPTVIMYKDGKEFKRKVGFGGRGGYEDLLREVV